MKGAYLLAGIQVKSFIRLVRSRPFSYRPKYLLRFLFVFQNALWASFFAWKEKLKYGKEISKHPIPDNPLIIIGHWRSGSTLLHKLMNFDDQLSSPTLFQTSQPNGFCSAARYFKPVMSAVIGKKRPFDRMSTGVDEPQEDEFALVRMSGFSPMLGLVFPEDSGFFLKKDTAYLPEKSNELEKWKNCLTGFTRKISWHSGKRVLLKNPFHSFRIKLLREIFPQAKFIHIYRNPLNVVPSSIRMWSVVGSQNTLNKYWKNPETEGVCEQLNRTLDAVEQDLAALPEDDWVEIRFEDLEKNPETIMEYIYSRLNLNFTETFREKLKAYLKSIENYQKNTYLLTEKDRELITNRLLRHMYRMEYLPYEEKQVLSGN